MQRKLLSSIKYILILACMLGMPSVTCHAQKEVWNRLGAYGGPTFNQHVGSFKPMSYVTSCCPEFNNAESSSLIIGPVLEWSAGNTTAIGFRTGYTSVGAVFHSNENIRMILNGQQVPGVLEHTFKAVLDVMPLIVYAKQQIYGPLFISAGPMMTFIPNPNFESLERIVEPTQAAYFQYTGRGGTSTRNSARGDMVDASYYMSIYAMLQGEIPLDNQRRYLLIPEVSATYGIQNLADVRWKIHSINFGLAFMWQYGKFWDPEGPIMPVKTIPRTEGDLQ